MCEKCVAAENLVTKRVIASFEMCALVPIKLDLVISNPQNCIFQMSFKLWMCKGRHQIINYTCMPLLFSYSRLNLQEKERHGSPPGLPVSVVEPFYFLLLMLDNED